MTEISLTNGKGRGVGNGRCGPAEWVGVGRFGSTKRVFDGHGVLHVGTRRREHPEVFVQSTTIEHLDHELPVVFTEEGKNRRATILGRYWEAAAGATLVIAPLDRDLETIFNPLRVRDASSPACPIAPETLRLARRLAGSWKREDGAARCPQSSPGRTKVSLRVTPQSAATSANSNEA